MFPSCIRENPLLVVIKEFVRGDADISEFIRQYNRNDALAEYLDDIIDYIAAHRVPIKRRTIVMRNINENKPFETRSYVERFIKDYAQDFRDLSDCWKENPPRVSAYLKTLSHVTAHGAFEIYSIVADIYYQMDTTLVGTKKYEEEYEFALDILPAYLSGGVLAENYVSQYIIPKYPITMKKGERKRLIKEEIRKAFQRQCKGFPRWIQMPEWPMGTDEKPMVYGGQKAFEDYSEYYFRDSVTGHEHIVTQWW